MNSDEKFVIESYTRIKLEEAVPPQSEPREIPQPMVSSLFYHKPERCHTIQDGIKVYNCRPYIKIKMVLFFRQKIPINIIKVVHYNTGSILSIKVDYDDDYDSNVPISGSRAKALLIEAAYYGDDAGNINSICVRVHDSDPDTSRGTETTVQH